MSQRLLWKFLLTMALTAWAVFSLYPFTDRKFEDEIKQEASAKREEFLRLMDRAAQRVTERQAASVFMALKDIGREERIDLSQYFPQVRLEASLRNIEKRNAILLDHLLKESRGRLQFGLDLRGGVAFTLEDAEIPSAGGANEVHKQKLEKAIDIIDTRINSLGVAEPIVRPVGANRIEIQIPGVSTKDNPEIVSVLKKPARLDFKIVHPQIPPQAERPPQSMVPPGYEIMSHDDEDPASGRSVTSYYIVKRVPEMTGEGIKDAFPAMDMYGKYEIHLVFNSEGADRFAKVTEANVGRLLGVVLDGKLYSAPRINERIGGGQAQITGSFTQREAVELANVLNNPLDAKLEIVEQSEVGATLAEDAVASAKLSFMISTALTIGFMLAFYVYGGVVAAIGMGLNVLITLGVMASIGATLTMPGIAGIVLTLAMSVDSNILVFERMREELKLGKSLPTALESGFDKAWSAILDSNITTLVCAVAMIVFGTGPVKGFGVTLTIGIFTTMFAAVVVSKLILEFIIGKRVIARFPMFSVLQNTTYDFMKLGKPAFIGSWLIVLVGVAVVAFKGRSIYGIDFAGGDMITFSFNQKVEVGELRKVVEKLDVRDASFSYQTQLGTGREVLKVTTNFDKGATVTQALQQAFPAAGLVVTGENRIGPSVGAEIQWKALLAIGASLVGILLYVAFRFEIGYGMGAIIATAHDLLMTIGIFVMFDRQFNGPMVAAILLIAGYSINDTIVVFDRIREELKLNPEGSLRDVINRALNLTLSRTIITGGTTFLTAITLILITTGDVNDIAFTLFIGVITGTFSSLFVASPVFFWWHKGDRRHVEEHKDLAPKYEWVGASKASQ